MIFATAEDCYANGVKMASLSDSYLFCDVSFTYLGNKTLVGWEIYNGNYELIATIEAEELFAPTEHGRYYALPIFVD